ncbi:hypothetical protein CONPUDRAFT_78087 [Coniophora puteana RWD-64-598 SS2]|uniref:Uncharacterized protein n=1 Tax=Coniophora puteana (strain RWD-64-598) TaxID=741705 RepID=R7SE43_CONPW|nr:uncharacterized protein CONPUDRAFT_78087 [Coniophora puteana RWD-64-598 SS2]EIW74443.1 hypothetical protein CONPUDRAFT_78087 [Coniophora puteana RWD-64-598 SS2]
MSSIVSGQTRLKVQNTADIKADVRVLWFLVPTVFQYHSSIQIAVSVSMKFTKYYIWCSPSSCKVNPYWPFIFYPLSTRPTATGMMAIRVYVLLGKSKIVFIILAIGYAISQGLNIVLGIYLLDFSPTLRSEWTQGAVCTCEQSTPANRAWVYPVGSMAGLAFDLIVCAFALVYAFKHVPKACCRNPARAALTLSVIIVRDNLVYFFFYNLTIIVQSMLQTMVGPWMIISLREAYERQTGYGPSCSSELTTVAFASIRVPWTDQSGDTPKSDSVWSSFQRKE